MIWIPTIEYILNIFKEKIGKSILMNNSGLKATLDKVQWGIPFQPDPTIWDRVTILYKSIVEEHFFADGNKRIGLLLAFIFLNNNGYDFITSNDDAYKIILEVAQGLKHMKKLKYGLNQILKKYD